jgi:hypothetical protein
MNECKINWLSSVCRPSGLIVTNPNWSQSFKLTMTDKTDRPWKSSPAREKLFRTVNGNSMNNKVNHWSRTNDTININIKRGLYRRRPQFPGRKLAAASTTPFFVGVANHHITISVDIMVDRHWTLRLKKWCRNSTNCRTKSFWAPFSWIRSVGRSLNAFSWAYSHQNVRMDVSKKTYLLTPSAC